MYDRTKRLADPHQSWTPCISLWAQPTVLINKVLTIFWFDSISPSGVSTQCDGEGEVINERAGDYQYNRSSCCQRWYAVDTVCTHSAMYGEQKFPQSQAMQNEPAANPACLLP